MRSLWIWGALGLVLLIAGGASNKTVRGWVMEPRGIRNNNPGNIRRGAKWQGLAPEQPDSEFATFVEPVWGIRALARTLRTYAFTHGLQTVREIINRWAPPVGRDSQGRTYTQDSSAYVNHVARSLGVDPDQRLDFDAAQLQALVAAIIRHENGKQPYSAELISDGIQRAGWV